MSTESKSQLWILSGLHQGGMPEGQRIGVRVNENDTYFRFNYKIQELIMESFGDVQLTRGRCYQHIPFSECKFNDDSKSVILPAHVYGSPHNAGYNTNQGGFDYDQQGSFFELNATQVKKMFHIIELDDTQIKSEYALFNVELTSFTSE